MKIKPKTKICKKISLSSSLSERFLGLLSSTMNASNLNELKIALTNKAKNTINKIMNNQTNQTQNRKAQQLASLVSEIVINKGTCFAGFTYNGKRRNLTLGAKLADRSSGGGSGGGSWGKSYANGALVEHKQALYLQGLPNNDTTRSIKRFKLSDVEDFVIG